MLVNFVSFPRFNYLIDNIIKIILNVLHDAMIKQPKFLPTFLLSDNLTFVWIANV